MKMEAHDYIHTPSTIQKDTHADTYLPMHMAMHISTYRQCGVREIRIQSQFHLDMYTQADRVIHHTREGIFKIHA